MVETRRNRMLVVMKRRLGVLAANPGEALLLLSSFLSQPGLAMSKPDMIARI